MQVTTTRYEPLVIVSIGGLLAIIHQLFEEKSAVNGCNSTSPHCPGVSFVKLEKLLLVNRLERT